MIRKGRIEDAADMASIYNHYVRTSTVIFSEKELSASDMTNKLLAMHVGDKFPFFIDEEEGAIRGYGYAHLWHPDSVYGQTWEVTIYLAPNDCAKGVGTSLLSEIIKASRENGAHVLISCITAGNMPCERMLQKLNFEKAGCLKEVGFKFGQYLDDVLYQLSL